MERELRPRTRGEPDIRYTFSVHARFNRVRLIAPPDALSVSLLCWSVP